jgi:phosphoribosylaminoimidazolecarboxamide formyltransferase/IMP cyclohydrolase
VEWADLRFAWAVVKHARSNAVVLARGGVTVGLGAGAVSRIWAAERAVANAGGRARGAVLASEAFFPFDDVVRLAAGAGVTAILQPGGAKRDPEVIAAANELGVGMVFTGSRHFRH